MSATLALVRDLVRSGQVRLSTHGYAALDEDDILYEEVLTGLSTCIVVEDCPEAGPGPWHWYSSATQPADHFMSCGFA